MLHDAPTGLAALSDLGSEPFLSAESERILDSLLANASDAVVVQELTSGRIVGVNRHAERLYGYTREEFLQCLFDRDLRANGRDRHEPSSDCATTIHDASRGRIRWHEHQSGAALPVEVATTQITLDGYDLLIATILDLRGQLDLQSALEARVEESEGLLELSTLLQTADDVSSTLDRIVEGASRLVGGNFAGIGLPDGNAVVIERALVDGEWHPVQLRIALNDRTAAGVVLKRGTVVTDAESPGAGGFDIEAMQHAGVRRFVMAPVRGHDGMIVALLGVCSRDPDYVYCERRTRLLEAAARHAGAAIERARVRQEQERLHRDAIQRAHEMSILVGATSVLHAADDPEHIVHDVGTYAAGLCPAEVVSVGLQHGDHFVIDRLWTDGTWSRFEYPATTGTSILRHVIETGRAYRSNDLSNDPRSDREFDQHHGFHRQLSVPLVGMDGQTLGVINLFNKVDGPFTDQDERLIGTLAVQGALALERVRSREALAETLSALTRSEERFRSLVQNISDVITLFGEDGTVRYQSPAIEAALGYDPSELVGRTVWSLFHPDDIPLLRSLEKATLASHGPQPPVELRFCHKDGSWRYFEAVTTNLLDDASVRAIVVISRDVTKRRHEEDAKRLLAEASAQLAASLDYESALSLVTQLAVPVLGDWCAALIFGEDGELDRVAVAAADAAHLELHDEIRRRYPFATSEGHAIEAAIREGRSHVIPRITARDYKRYAQDDEHERLLRAIGTSSWMTVPMVGRRTRLGALSFGLTHESRQFTDEDLALAQELSRRVALAVENAQLYHELAERKEQLEDLVARLLTAHEEERRRAAYEVHDGVAQVAASAHQHLQAYGARHRPRRPEARQELDRAISLAQRTVQEARRVVAGLRPTVLDDFGLATALRHEVESLRSDGWEITYEQDLGGERLPPQVESALYRVAQEAIANTRKHAGVQRLALRLQRTPSGITLRVRDWGKGFDPEVSEPGAPGERVGIAGMQERITLLGGTFKLSSLPRWGTEVVADVPVDPAAPN